MSLVIDVGCENSPEANSVRALIEHFHPQELYGLDPRLMDSVDMVMDGTSVSLRPWAAWSRSGHVRFINDGTRSRVSNGVTGRSVLAEDLAEVIESAPGPVILKLDCEGGEYELIPHLIETGAYLRVEKWLIEWHGEPIPNLPFEWEPWWM